VAKALGVTDERELKAIEAGALLHDIGKLAVPDYVLNKPGALSRSEYDTMKKHASLGARILTAVDFPYPVVPIVRHHHEQWNGSGYPDGLVGAEIPLGARILAVVDCFDALTSDRPYRPRLSDARAIEMLRERKGSFYDSAVVEKVIELIPVLRRDDAANRDGSEARGSLVAGLVRRVGNRRPECDADQAATGGAAVPRQVRVLIDDQLARIATAEACLYAINPAGDALRVVHATSSLHDGAAFPHIHVGDGVSGWVAANRSTIGNADPALDMGELAAAWEFRSCTSTPVFVSGDLFGVLTVYGKHATGLSDDAVRVVGRLAQEVGLMLARADAEGEKHHAMVAAAPDRPMAAAF